jgi:5-formyltetrahydrofolate cyclo-ligase
MLSARAGLPEPERASASRAIAARLEALPAWDSARTVALYASMGAEVDTGALARRAAAAGKRVVWPRLARSGTAMEFAACGLDDLVPGPARALEPPPSAPAVPPAEIDLVLVPGLAFDPRCGRLGRGRGHYDATLSGLSPTAFRAGLAFESQVVPEVPVEPHDVPLDAVITEARVLLAGHGPG